MVTQLTPGHDDGPRLVGGGSHLLGPPDEGHAPSVGVLVDARDPAVGRLDRVLRGVEDLQAPGEAGRARPAQRAARERDVAGAHAEHGPVETGDAGDAIMVSGQPLGLPLLGGEHAVDSAGSLHPPGHAVLGGDGPGQRAVGGRADSLHWPADRVELAERIAVGAEAGASVEPSRDVRPPVHDASGSTRRCQTVNALEGGRRSRWTPRTPLWCIRMQGVSEKSRKRLTRVEQQAQTRRRVLEAADRVFTERGFHAARLEEIAETAGYTRGAVYSNFKNKDELALALIEERIAKSKALLEELAASQDPDVGGAQAVGQAFSDLFVKQNHWAPLFLEFVTHASRHPELAKRLRAPYRGLADAIAKALEAASDQAGVPLPVASQRLARIMLAATNGSDIERMIDPKRADGALAGEMLGWIAGGLLASADK